MRARKTMKFRAATITQKRLIDRPAASGAVVVAVAAKIARGFT
jgi:hypothetical protein